MCLTTHVQYLSSTRCRCQSFSWSRQRFGHRVQSVIQQHRSSFCMYLRTRKLRNINRTFFEMRVLKAIVINTHNISENPCSPILRRQPHRTKRKIRLQLDKPIFFSRTTRAQDSGMHYLHCILAICFFFIKDILVASLHSSIKQHQARLAQSVERETLSTHGLTDSITQYISRLWVRPPRRAFR